MNRPPPVPLSEIALRRKNPENPLLLNRLRRTRATEYRRPVRGQRHQRPHLIVSLDHRRQQFRSRRSTGGDHRAGPPGFHRPAEGEKTGAALLEVPPEPHESRRFRPGQRLDECRVPRAGTHHEFTNPRREALPHRVHCWHPCVHAPVLSDAPGNVQAGIRAGCD